MQSVPGAVAGSPRGVLDTTGWKLFARIEIAMIVTRSLSLPVLTSSLN